VAPLEGDAGPARRDTGGRHGPRKDADDDLAHSEVPRARCPVEGDTGHLPGEHHQDGSVKPKTLSTSQEFLHLFFLCSLVRVCI